MEAILNFQQDLNVDLLDRIVNVFYCGVGPERDQAQNVLTQFQKHPDAWQKVDKIIEHCKSDKSKFIGLQILEDLIKTRWNILPAEQKEGIKNYIVSMIISKSSDEQTLVKERVFIGKLNMILVQVVKHEWPKNWPNFIGDIVGSSRSSVSLCENNMNILKLLSEEVFDFSAEQMTTIKARNLKDQFNLEFSEIFRLCNEVLGVAQKPSLVIATLNALLRFLKWIPVGYMLETDLVTTLRDRCLTNVMYQNLALGCLTEIGALSISQEYDERFLSLFITVMDGIYQILPLTVDLNLSNTYANLPDDRQTFIQNLAMFLTSYLGAHLKLVENCPRKEYLINAHLYLLAVSDIDDRELFRVCLEYWSKLVTGLYEDLSGNSLPLLGMSPVSPRRSVYSQILSSLRLVMINRMVKPEEVLITEDDNGEIVREVIKESDTIQLYKNMKEVLVYLTHLDAADTEGIMLTKLAAQMDNTEWSWNNLNKLCWAIGSVSGALPEEAEKHFLVIVIKDLLSLCEMKRGKDNKAVVASNVLYVVGQYPRFLKSHWKFLKTVVKKLFEFMHELHEGVQDMSCDTFIKIAQKCRRQFVVLQPQESCPFIEEIIMDIPSIISDLQPQQINTFYEALGCIIQAQPDAVVQAGLVRSLMGLPNSAWDRIVMSASKDITVLQVPENCKTLVHVIKTNIAACGAIGPGFVVQLGRIFNDLLSVYRSVSGIISESVAKQGLIATKTPIIRGMRAIKKETLRLIDIFVQKCEDVQVVKDNMVPPLFEVILVDYTQSVEPAKDAEVLNLVAALVTKMGALLNDYVPVIFNSVFECTLGMINKDFSEYPEHRASFFKMIQSLNEHCFSALLKLNSVQFKLIMDSIVWAFKHTIRDIADVGLTICLALLENVASADKAISNGFYQSYFISLLQDIFFVLTDTSHKAGFKLQAQVLAHMFGLVERNQIATSLFDPSLLQANPNLNNSLFLKEFVVKILVTAFPNLQPFQVETFVLGLFELNMNIAQFKAHLRDFLVKLKEFSENNDELFREELELEQERKVIAEKEARMKIPGMVKPAELNDDMMD